jgi:hypothetical protein
VEQSSWDDLYRAFRNADVERRAQEALERGELELRRQHDAWAELATGRVLAELRELATFRAAELAARTGVRLAVRLCDDIAAAQGKDLPRVASVRLAFHEREVAVYVYRMSGDVPFVHLMHSTPPHVATGRARWVTLPGCRILRRGDGHVLERLEPRAGRSSAVPITIDELVRRAFELALPAVRFSLS